FVLLVSLSLLISLVFLSLYTSLFSLISVFFLIVPPPPISTLFPYTTLFRSIRRVVKVEHRHLVFEEAVVKAARLMTRIVAHHGVDRKSTRLNSSHVKISYAVFCLKKKKQSYITKHRNRNSETTYR